MDMIEFDNVFGDAFFNENQRILNEPLSYTYDTQPLISKEKIEHAYNNNVTAINENEDEEAFEEEAVGEEEEVEKVTVDSSKESKGNFYIYVRENEHEAVLQECFNEAKLKMWRKISNYDTEKYKIKKLKNDDESSCDEIDADDDNLSCDETESVNLEDKKRVKKPPSFKQFIKNSNKRLDNVKNCLSTVFYEGKGKYIAKRISNRIIRLYRTLDRVCYTWINPKSLDDETSKYINGPRDKIFFKNIDEINEHFKIILDCNKCFSSDSFERFFMQKYPYVNKDVFATKNDKNEYIPNYYILKFRVDLKDYSSQKAEQTLVNDLYIKLKKISSHNDLLEKTQHETFCVNNLMIASSYYKLRKLMYQKQVEKSKSFKKNKVESRKTWDNFNVHFLHSCKSKLLKTKLNKTTLKNKNLVSNTDKKTLSKNKKIHKQMIQDMNIHNNKMLSNKS